MKVNFNVKMKVTIEFLVEMYFHLFVKYFTWGNIQPTRDFLDTLYNVWLKTANYILRCSNVICQEKRHLMRKKSIFCFWHL